MKDYIDIIKKDKEVNNFINTLSTEEIEMNLCMLLEQVKANDICNKCKGKKECLSDVVNMQSYLIKNTSIVTREYCDCNYKTKSINGGLERMFFPHQMNFDDIDMNPRRSVVFKEFLSYLESDGTKGIYLHGPFGTGKTYLMMYLAKQIVEKKNKKVIFAYYPELVREVKSSIANNTLDSLIVKLKNIDVLMLDDFGAELNSSFIRDEFLGPILQYRMMAGLPVFMTSNYDIKTLTAHLSETRDESNVLKASRIIERIAYMMKVVKLDDINHRL